MKIKRDDDRGLLEVYNIYPLPDRPSVMLAVAKARVDAVCARVELCQSADDCDEAFTAAECAAIVVGLTAAREIMRLLDENEFESAAVLALALSEGKFEGNPEKAAAWLAKPRRVK